MDIDDILGINSDLEGRARGIGMEGKRFEMFTRLGRKGGHGVYSFGL